VIPCPDDLPTASAASSEHGMFFAVAGGANSAALSMKRGNINPIRG
jgi:hypothetical protein